MDMLFALPVVGLVCAYGIICWLIVSGVRRVMRRQFPRLSRRYEQNDAAKFTSPIVVGILQAVLTPSVIWSWLGVVFPDGTGILVMLWSQVIIGATAGIASAVIYRWIRAVIRARVTMPPPGQDMPPDADGP